MEFFYMICDNKLQLKSGTVSNFSVITTVAS